MKSFFSNLSQAQAVLLVGIITVIIGGVITGYFNIREAQIPIEATLTAEAKQEIKLTIEAKQTLQVELTVAAQVATLPTFTPTMPLPTTEPTSTVTITPAPTNIPTPTSAPTYTPEPSVVIPTRVRETDNAIMVYVPAGKFTMGNNGGPKDQQPAHTVDLEAFWIDKFEVTNAKYQLCVEAGKCVASLYADDSKYNADEQPVVGVFWNTGALAYCEWAGVRLPTEAEWEKAAKGDDERLYPWGNVFDAGKLNSGANQEEDNFFDAAAPVGHFPNGASPYGALDMSGNVWEWTSSIYAPYPYIYDQQREDPDKNGSTTRVVRGGSWKTGLDPNGLTTTWRSHFTRGTRYPDTGFRCAVSANE